MNPTYRQIVVLGVIAWIAGCLSLWAFGTGWLSVASAAIGVPVIMWPVIRRKRVSTDG